MGWDIHGYIDVLCKNSSGSLFTRLDLSRNRTLFGVLAGVGDPTIIPLFPPRGFPEIIPDELKMDLQVAVLEDKIYESVHLLLPLCCVDYLIDRSTAEKWVREGASKWIDLKYVSKPSVVSPSWLTVDELKRCREVLISLLGFAGDLDIIIAAMDEMPNSRFIFWFDH